MKAQLKKIKQKFVILYESIIRNIDGDMGNNLRYKFYKKRFKHLAENVRLDTGCYFYGAEFITIKKNTHIDKGCVLVASNSNIDLSYRAIKYIDNKNINVKLGELIIGENCHISQHAMIYAYGGVKIGNNCVLSAGAKIYSLNSSPTNPFDKKMIISIVPYDGISPTIWGPIELQENVWLGINTLVFPGVVIEKNSFSRSNSVIIDSFEENSYLSGDPAKRIKNRFGD